MYLLTSSCDVFCFARSLQRARTSLRLFQSAQSLKYVYVCLFQIALDFFVKFAGSKWRIIFQIHDLKHSVISIDTGKYNFQKKIQSKVKMNT